MTLLQENTRQVNLCLHNTQEDEAEFMILEGALGILPFLHYNTSVFKGQWGKVCTSLGMPCGRDIQLQASGHCEQHQVELAAVCLTAKQADK